MHTNHLLDNSELPNFTAIDAKHFEPAIEIILNHYNKIIKKVTSIISDSSVNAVELTWDNSIQLLEEQDACLSNTWGIIEHLNNVNNTKEIREAYELLLPKITDFHTDFMQNQKIYNVYLALKASENFEQLDVAQKKIITNAIRDFKLSGIDLDSDSKDKYKKIVKKLSQLSNKFGNNVLDATMAWQYKVLDDNKDKLQGIPDYILNLAKNKAKEQNSSSAKGKDSFGWILTLEMPVYIAVMQYASNQKLREEFYQAYSTRAPENSEIIDEILRLRQELAKLVGFNNYAEYSLADKMAPNANKVIEFLEDLNNKSYNIAKQELLDLEKFAKTKIQPWDASYYEEQYKNQVFKVAEEQLREYFPESQVLTGMFALAEKLFSIKIVEEENFIKWHPSVRLFAVYDRNNSLRGKFYIDLYARDLKRSGAWAAERCARMRFSDGHLQLPVGFLVANFAAPTKDKPALLTHSDIVTLFHEFGHTLHNVVTQIDYASVAGTNDVAWDAVELPSQFMENWCWEWEVVEQLSCHYQTQEKLPKEQFDKLLATKNFLSAMKMVRQLEFSLFDMQVHMQDLLATGTTVQQILDQVRAQVAVLNVPKYNKFQNSFSHIFDGGYSAGYYSYKWAEVLSSDAFELFKSSKTTINSELGKKFIEIILEQGGAKDAMELFVAFLGREPTVDALLKHSGIGA